MSKKRNSVDCKYIGGMMIRIVLDKNFQGKKRKGTEHKGMND